MDIKKGNNMRAKNPKQNKIKSAKKGTSEEKIRKKRE
jgi:hypothetical protein